MVYIIRCAVVKNKQIKPLLGFTVLTCTKQKYQKVALVNVIIHNNRVYFGKQAVQQHPGKSLTSGKHARIMYNPLNPTFI